MRYPASDKAEIIELVEQSHLPAKRTLDKLGIPRATFYRWYDRYCNGGPEALADHRSRPDRVWNRIPDDVRGQIIDLALELPELSPRELAVRFTDDDRIYLGRLGHRRHCQNYERNGREQRSDGVAQFTTADGAVAKFKAAGPYSKDTVIGEFVKTVASTNIDYSFAKACAAGVEAELSRTAAKS